MNLFNKVKCRWDNNGEMWFDIAMPDIGLIQKAALMGGTICIFKVDVLNFYFISYCYHEGKVHIQTTGCEITEEQYNSQLLAWDGDQSIHCPQGTELTLVDNSYFLKPNVQ